MTKVLTPNELKDLNSVPVEQLPTVAVPSASEVQARTIESLVPKAAEPEPHIIEPEMKTTELKVQIMEEQKVDTLKLEPTKPEVHSIPVEVQISEQEASAEKLEVPAVTVEGLVTTMEAHEAQLVAKMEVPATEPEVLVNAPAIDANENDVHANETEVQTSKPEEKNPETEALHLPAEMKIPAQETKPDSPTDHVPEVTQNSFEKQPSTSPTRPKITGIAQLLQAAQLVLEQSRQNDQTKSSPPTNVPTSDTCDTPASVPPKRVLPPPSSPSALSLALASAKASSVNSVSPPQLYDENSPLQQEELPLRVPIALSTAKSSPPHAQTTAPKEVAQSPLSPVSVTTAKTATTIVSPATSKTEMGTTSPGLSPLTSSTPSKSPGGTNATSKTAQPNKTDILASLTEGLSEEQDEFIVIESKPDKPIEQKAKEPTPSVGLSTSTAAISPAKPRWVDETKVKKCASCGSAFSVLNRKCCHQKIALPKLGYSTKELVCDACYYMVKNS
ncbi:hypothetical protein Pelo_10686 [Pelomyxa schiedti]|nr:hypothetical protein Pelo_10686 [Pelomyxa schiedti]